jgi:hypothetical protein
MNIGRLPPVSGTAERPTPGQSRHASSETSERSLVPLAGRSHQENRQAPSATPSARPLPAFLAHLIATAQHAPQTRARSRMEPADAIAHYNSALSVTAPPRIWERSV